MADFIAARAFTVGGSLGKTMKVWIASFPHLFIASLLVYGPLFAVEWLAIGDPTARLDAASARMRVAAFRLIELVFGFILQGVVVMIVFQKLRDEPPDLFRSLRAGVTRLPALLGIAIMVGVSAVGCVIPGVLLAAFVTPFLMVTMLFAVYPVLVWFVASPAAIVERIGVGAALTRSAKLTKGDRPKILGAYLALVLLSSVIGAFVGVIIGAFVTLDGMWSRALGSILGGMLSSVLSVVIYHDLREAKEGIGIDALATVFD